MGRWSSVDNPALLPAPQKTDHIEEPYVRASIMVPKDYVGAVMELCQKKRGIYSDMEVIDDARMNVIYEIPLGEIVFDFFDRLQVVHEGIRLFGL